MMGALGGMNPQMMSGLGGGMPPGCLPVSAERNDNGP